MTNPKTIITKKLSPCTTKKLNIHGSGFIRKVILNKHNNNNPNLNP